MDPIAVVGLACLFPGADTPAEFWDNLIERRDCTSDLTARQIGVDPGVFLAPRKGLPDHYYTLRGGYVRDPGFDATGYALPADELARLDPQFRWSLYVAREALRDAGLLGAPALRRCGLALGSLSFPTRASHRLLAPHYYRAMSSALGELLERPDFKLLEPWAGQPPPARCDGLLAGFSASVVARALGLGGPSFCLDAACATSLYAVKLAMHYLGSGQADLMLAGAVSAADPFFNTMGFSIFQAYPEPGQASRPLDRSSRGLISGEGAGLLVLKRLADARADGDRIHAVIRGLGLSNDGRGRHPLVPNAQGQLVALRRAYAEASADPAEVGYLECHATGTPLGDATELEALEAHFGAAGAPLIGAVKSNLGHLLTTAGLAGLIKVITSLERSQIPPTLHLEDPLTSPSGAIGPRQCVAEPTSWPTERPLGAVSAFGFGGANAHAVLERADASTGTEPAAPGIAPLPALEVVGLAASFGRCDGLEALAGALYRGETLVGPAPAGRWGDLAPAPDGAYVERIEVDYLRLKVPPKPDDRPIPQQLLMLQVADRALRDAGLAPGANVAVIVALGTEPSLHQFRARVELGWQLPASLAAAGIELTADQQAELERIAKDGVHPEAQVSRYVAFIGNITASRVSALWDFSGPSFTVSAEELSTFRAVELARLLLAAGEVEAVLVGAVDLAAGFEAAALRDQCSAPGPLGDGAGAIVLKRSGEAERSYARLEALQIVGGTGGDLLPAGDPATVAEAAGRALAEAGYGPGEVGLLDLSAADPTEAELPGLLRALGDEPGPPTCALTSTPAFAGRTGAASGMAGLVRTILCISERYLPGWPAGGSTRPGLPDRGRFYFASTARPWLTERPADRRVAAVGSLALDGSYGQAILSEGARPRQRGGAYRPDRPCFLFPLAGRDAPALRAELEHLRGALLADPSLSGCAAASFDRYRARGAAEYAVAIVGDDRERLLREVDQALDAVPAALATGGVWSTPPGSYFSGRPLGPSGEVAFVYPGGFSAYPGLGADLFHLAPELHDRLAGLSSNPAGVAGAGLLYPPERGPGGVDRRAAAAALEDDVVALLEAGTTFSVLMTALVRERWLIEPRRAFGYSSGESTMYWALGVWDAADESSRRLRASPLFRTALAGPKEAARELLGQAALAAAGTGDFWASFVVKAPLREVRDRVSAAAGVYLTHVNTPREVVIAGLPDACRRIIRELDCHAVRVPVSVANHCPVIERVYDAYLDLYRFPIARRPAIDLYAQADFSPTELETETLARTLVDGFRTYVDFPRLVERVYGDGARIFVEPGPGSTCSGYVEAILADRPHLAVSFDKRGVDSHRSIVRALARLVSHRVPLDLAPLYGSAEPAEHARPGALATVTLEAPNVRAAIVSDELRRRLARPAAAPPAAPPRPHPEPTPVGSGSLPARPPAPIRESPAAPAAAVVRPALLPPLQGPGPAPAELQLSFLEGRLEALRAFGELIGLQTALLGDHPAAVGGPPPSSIAPVRPAAPPTVVRPGPIWDQAALLEFAAGRIANVFGAEYAAIDGYRRRVRLPTPPYLLVSRVTRLAAERGRFEPCSLTTEYDIPDDAWYLVDGQAPLAVAVESGQCDLLLISYLGIDFENRGERVYRLLDCTLTFRDDFPVAGETLRYDIRIDRFAQSGESLLFFFSYECYAGGRHLLSMTGGCAGFFSDEELERGRGVIESEAERRALAAVQRRSFEPPLTCSRSSFGPDDLQRLGRGELAEVFGPAHAPGGRNRSLRLPDGPLLMFDRVLEIDPSGGRWGLGRVVAEKDLQPDGWYFTCHFKDDPVLAGSLVGDGCSQLLQLYLLYLGFQTRTADARFQPIRGLAQSVRCRGQITPAAQRLTYVLEVTELGLEPEPFARANVDVLLDGRAIVSFRDLGLRLAEQSERSPDRPAPAVRPAPRFNLRQIEQFALGSMSACFGPDYARYDERRAPRTPNGELMLLSRVVQIEGQRGAVRPGAWLVAEYDVPADPWFTRENGSPSTPYSILMELGLQPCGFLSAYLGSTLPYPDEDFYFRNLDGTGRLSDEPDLRGRTVACRVRLLSSDALDGVIIQKFAYQLSSEGRPFFEGEAVFGYFRAAALAGQAGLDGGREAPTWLDQHEAAGPLRPDLGAFRAGGPAAPTLRLPHGRLALLDAALVVPDGGQAGRGYVFAEYDVQPESWFFRCHFHQDPVMPGSLGVEAILQALQTYALAGGLGRELRRPRFALATGVETRWKYRGQLVPGQRDLRLEAHLERVETTPEGCLLTARASLWNGARRIYEVQDAAIALRAT